MKCPCYIEHISLEVVGAEAVLWSLCQDRIVYGLWGGQAGLDVKYTNRKFLWHDSISTPTQGLSWTSPAPGPIIINNLRLEKIILFM